MSECATKCQMCDKRGLPLLITRYAIAPDDSGAPAVNGSFSVVDTNGTVMPLGGKAIYTQRLLRSGYLYVFDEARNKWQGYFVTAEGYLMPFAITPFGPIGPAVTGDPAKIAPCNRQANGAVAGCITITSPKQASNVWLGFSDVEWTPSVWKQHQDAAFRARHMRKFDVKHWMTSGTHHHAGGIYLHAANVAEYAPAVKKQTFAFSPAPFADRTGCSDSLIKAFENIQPGKGAFVAIDDPAGMAMDLAALAHERLRSFIDDVKTDKERARKLAVSSAIAQLASAIQNQAELDEIDAARDLETQAMANAGPALLFKSVRDRVEAIGKVSAADLDRARADAWKKYDEKYDENARAAWQGDYDKQLEAYTRSALNPLATAHVAWMTSQQFVGLGCNFDRDDIRSSITYTALVYRCVKGTAGLKPCSEQYCKFLDVDLDHAFDATNILHHALIYNYSGLEEAAKNATNIDTRILPWDAIYGPYKVAVEHVGKGEADVAALLMHELAGPVSKVAAKVLDGPARLILGIMSLHAGKPWVKVSLHGSRKEFRRLLVRRVIEIGGAELNERQIKVAVDKEIQRLQIRGDKLEGQRGAKWVALLDEKQIRGLPANTAQQAEWLQGKLTSPAALEELGMARWKGIINGEVRMGVVSGILQIICFTKLLEDEQNAMAADKTEAWSRLAAGALAIVGSVCEISGLALEKVPSFASETSAGIRALLAPQRLLLASRVLGVVAGVIMAGWDFWKGVEAIEQHKLSLGGLYFSSTILGLAVTYGFLVSWNPLVLVVLVAAFVFIAWLLEKYKDNKLQSWLERCIFGKSEQYSNAALEQREFTLALK